MARGVANQRRTRNKPADEIISELRSFKNYLERGALVDCSDSLKIIEVDFARLKKLLTKDIKERNKWLNKK